MANLVSNIYKWRRCKMAVVYVRLATFKVHILIQRIQAVYRACSQRQVKSARPPYLFSLDTWLFRFQFGGTRLPGRRGNELKYFL